MLKSTSNHGNLAFDQLEQQQHQLATTAYDICQRGRSDEMVLFIKLIFGQPITLDRFPILDRYPITTDFRLA